MDSLLPRPSSNLKRKSPPSDHGDESAQRSTVSPEQLNVPTAVDVSHTTASETQQVGPEKHDTDASHEIYADTISTTARETPEMVDRESPYAPNETDTHPFDMTASETPGIVDQEKPNGPNVTDADAQQAFQMLMQAVSNFNYTPNYNANASSSSISFVNQSTPSTSATPSIDHGSVFSLSSTTFQPISDFIRRPRKEQTCLKCGKGYRLCKGATLRKACSNPCRYCGCKECTGHCRD